MFQQIAIDAPVSSAEPATDVQATGLSNFERCVLAVGLFEIPLQLDKYFFFREKDSLLGALGGINVSITTIALIVLYAVWLGNATASGQSRRVKVILGVPLLIYLSANVLSVLVAPVRALAMFDCVLLLQSYLLYAYVVNRVVTRADLVFVLQVIVAMVGFQALAVVGLGLAAAPGAEYHLGPVDFTVRSDGRPEGTLRSPNGAGSVLYILSMVSAASLFLLSGWRKGTAIGVLLLAVVAIFMTETRGAILTLAIGGAMVGAGAAYRRWVPNALVIASVLVAAGSALPFAIAITKRFQESGGESAKSRIHLSAIAMEAIRDQPWLGSGAGNCHIVTEKYALQAEFRSEWFFTTHCKYLLVWVETGLFGLAAFLAMLVCGLLDSISAWLSFDRVAVAVGLTVFAALAGHMLHLAVDIFNSRTQVQCLWLTLAIASVAARIGRQSLPDVSRGTLR